MNGRVSERERRLVLGVLRRWEERRACAFVPRREVDAGLLNFLLGAANCGAVASSS